VQPVENVDRGVTVHAESAVAMVKQAVAAPEASAGT
jgi:hypothetical protein